MTDKERQQIIDTYRRHNYRCFVTGLEATQRAHVIGNTKANRKRFGSEIIDSPLNWLPAHDLAANALIDVGRASDLPNKIAAAIKANDREEVERLVRENIERKLGKRNER